AWQWAGDDPQAASRWASAFPERKARERAYENLMNRWSQNDAYAAGAWLGTLPAGPSRDAAVTAYTQRVVATDPQTAVQWAETFAETFEFENEIETIDPLLFILRRFLQQLSLRLSALYLVAKDLKLRITFSDKKSYEHVFKIPEPSNNEEVLFRMLHTHL